MLGSFFLSGLVLETWTSEQGFRNGSDEFHALRAEEDQRGADGPDAADADADEGDEPT